MKTINSIHAAINVNIGFISSGLLFGSLLLSANCFSQQILASSPASPQVESPSPTAVPLAQFVGFYQLPNKVAFIEFSVSENTLFAKQLWDAKEYELERVGDADFKSKNEGHPVTFIKDRSGNFGRAKILGRIMTAKVFFDPTIVQPLSAAQLKRLEGSYTLKDDAKFELVIRSSADGLLLKQLWDDKEIAFTPRAETFFLNEDGTFPLTFKLSNEEAIELNCFENDIWLKDK